MTADGAMEREQVVETWLVEAGRRRVRHFAAQLRTIDDGAMWVPNLDWSVADLAQQEACPPSYWRAQHWAGAGFEVLPQIDTSTLMIWSLEDTALSKQTADGTAAHVASLTTRFLAGVSHRVQQEAPKTVNAMLLAWLDDDPVPEGDDVVVERLAEPAP